MPHYIELDQASDVAAEAASRTVEALGAAIAADGAAVWVLAGGTSPLAAYRLIVQDHADAIDWSRVTVVIGDERLTPLDHPDSNWGQIIPVLTAHDRTALLGRVEPRPELGLDAAAADYERRLRELPASPAGVPRLDVVWLGVGEDGHTLSLFPGQETTWRSDGVVAAVRDSPKPPPERITLTLAALAGARDVIVFATGAGKREALARARDTGELPIAVASAHAEEAGARVVWLYDGAARS